MKNRKRWIVIIIAVAVVMIAVTVGIIFYNNSDSIRFQKQLDLGQKYLSEMNYEEAIVAFHQAIEIDPRSADAYLGLADAYLGMGDTEAALEVLEKGYEATGDERLQERMDELYDSREETMPVSEEVADNIVEVPEFTGDLDEIIELIQDTTKSTSGQEHLLTYEQLESAFRPLAEQLELYLAGHQDDADAWGSLAKTYLHLGEMDKCLETRQKGYDITGEPWLLPELRTDEYGQTIDEYGRILSLNESTYTYGEGDRYLTADFGDRWHEREYDEYGRTAKVIYNDSSINYYEYSGNNSVVVTWDDGYSVQAATIIYDEYGRQTNLEDPSHDREFNFEIVE